MYAQVHAALRKWLLTNLSDEIAEGMRIVYGGSVKVSHITT